MGPSNYRQPFHHQSVKSEGYFLRSQTNCKRLLTYKYDTESLVLMYAILYPNVNCTSQMLENLKLYCTLRTFSCGPTGDDLCSTSKRFDGVLHLEQE